MAHIYPGRDLRGLGTGLITEVTATIGAPGDEVVIATTNVRHLSRFPGVDARTWSEIA